MKRLQYFVFACLLFMSFTVSVEALKCNYTWSSTIFSYEEDENGDPIPAERTFSLETGTDNDRLTIASASGNRVITYASNNGIAINDDGTCPTISIYAQRVFGGFKIYKTNNSCKDGFLTTDDRCSPNLTPTTGSDDTSTANDAGSTGQFRLIDSDNNSCQYERPTRSGDTTVYDYITITRSYDTNVEASCDVQFAESCRVRLGINSSEFFPNDTFTCAPYLNTTYEYNAGMEYTINELGKEGDTDIAEDLNESWQRPNAIDTSGWNGPVECSDIFKINEEGSFGWMLNTILGYIKVIAPILVVLLSAIDFIKAVFGFDEKAMKEAQHKLIIRLIAAVALFLIPQLIQLIMNFINVSLDPACFLQ